MRGFRSPKPLNPKRLGFKGVLGGFGGLKLADLEEGGYETRNKDYLDPLGF